MHRVDQSEEKTDEHCCVCADDEWGTFPCAVGGEGGAEGENTGCDVDWDCEEICLGRGSAGG